MDHRQLDSLIEELSGTIPNVPAIQAFRTRHEWAPIWSLCSSIQAGFKEVRYPTGHERQQAWLQFQELRLRASEMKRHEDEGFLNRSIPHRDAILSDLRPLKVDLFIDMLTLHQTDVAEVKALGQALREVRQRLRDYRDDMIREHIVECNDAIADVKRNHDWWWDEYKKMLEKRSEQYAQKHREYEERQRQERRAERRQHIRDTIDRLEDSLERLHATRDKLRAKLSEDEEKLRETTSPKWEGIFPEWISQKEEWLSENEDRIRNVELWIQENRAKLRGLE